MPRIVIETALGPMAPIAHLRRAEAAVVDLEREVSKLRESNQSLRRTLLWVCATVVVLGLTLLRTIS
jgi:hypothetical protein